MNRKLKRINKGNTHPFDEKYALEAVNIVNNWNVLKPVSLDFYNYYSKEAWAIACGMVGMYQIITHELIDFLNHIIGKSSAIEICAGYGVMGRALKIPIIDRKLHLDPNTKEYYNAYVDCINQLPQYPIDVIEMTANKAHVEYKPDWIIGCWVTQKLMPGSKIGMKYGPIEEKFLETSNYITIGSGHLHSHKYRRINKLPHYIIEADWIIDRTSHKSTSQMRIWTDQQLNFNDFPEHLEFTYFKF